MKKFIIKTKGPILPGSISTAHAKCGNPSCRCQHDKKPHGPYYRWTGFWAGRRTTKTLPEKTSKECLKRIKNYKSFIKQYDQIMNDALKFLFP